MRRFLGAAGVAAMLSACGGSGSGGGDGSGSDTIEGVFVDSPVTGLEFVGEQGRGFTGDDGGFTAAGVVAFLIGDIELGSAPAAAFLTPADLVPGAGAGADPAANRIVTNIIRLLQTLDADGNPANGIRIPEDALAAGGGRTLVFDQPVEDFAADPDVQAYLCAALSPEGPCDEPVDLVPVEAAREHLRATLDHIAEHGAPNRLPIADAGDDQAVASGDAVTLDGGASTDPDPRPETPDPIVAWHWRQTAGPVVELAEGENPALRSFTPQVADDAELVFELTVTDDDGGQASDTVTVQVAGGGGTNTPPVADAGSFSLLADRTLAERVTASDPDGDDLELSVVEEPANGSLDFADDGRFTYVPDAGFTGTDTFSFKANDGAADSEPAQVAIELRPIPVARLVAGAAKRTVTPQQRHIDGVAEPRLGGSETLQQFHLGGFGIGPLQNFPDPLRQRLTDPAGERVLETEAGPEDTWVRVLVLSLRDADGNDTEVAFVSLDAVGAGNVVQAGLKAAVHAATGLPEDNILFGQTHSHAGADLQGLWGGVPQEWIDDPLEGDGLYQLAAAAAVEAYARQRPAALSVAQTSLPELNSYRRPAVHGDEDADTTATLLQARDDDGALLASLLQYNAHPTVVGTGAHDGVDGLDARVPHADYVLGAVENLEADGGVALYYNGPIADASSSGPGGANDYDKARNRGSAIADGARGGEPRALGDSLSVRHAEAVLPVTNLLFVGAAALGSFNRYYDFAQIPFADIPGLGGILAGEAANLPQTAPVARTLVSRVTVGGPDGLEIVTIPGEATNTFGGYIRHLAGGTDVMLLGLTQNSFGYIVPEEEFNYVSETGDTGFVLPFTNYEEYVSLGPFTAPLLRLQAYNPLFDAPPKANLPPSLAACLGMDSGDACILTDLAARPGWYQREYGETCRENLGEDEAFCELIDPGPGGQLAEACREAGAPEDFCGLLELGEGPGGGDPPTPDPELVAASLDASLRGCDVLDTGFCLFPFPNDHFTAADPAAETGRRVDFNPLAMPRNVAGKPVDPTEWNRNDGFSPGQMILTYVPGLDLEATGAVPLTNLVETFDDRAPVMLVDAETGVRRLAWAELDANAGKLLPAQDVDRVDGSARPALIIRPAENLEPGRRYVVVLRDLKDAAGEPIAAPAAFAACRDGADTGLPAVDQRCDALDASVFPVLDMIGVARDESLYLAWDFTVASSGNLTGRLVHMRDDAFAALGEQGHPDDPDYRRGEAPGFTVDTVVENPDDDLSRRIEGTFTVPSYVVPADPSPLEGAELQSLLDQAKANLPPELGDLGDVLDLAGGASLPPNRLFYDPFDGSGDRLGYGDGLPDRTHPGATLTARYVCNVPKAAVADFEAAAAEDVNPARASLYGHGLLGSRTEVGAGNVEDMGNEHNVLFCATDWFGFASGDIPNIATVLLDMSFFPVVPDASQQGMLNFLFLARLLNHPDGFAAHPAFQVQGRPVFDHRHVFYDGNSQGGILGGPVVAVSKDIERGVLGVPGMNYSTLLRRSVDFAPYSIPLYLSYTGDLERSFLLSMMQMLWDRSENNGYAQHLNRDPLPGTRRSEVLLHPAFGDHQVSMWTADVMTRTIRGAVDDSRVDPARHPDELPYYAIDVLDYGDDGRFEGSAMVVWDDGEVPPPPTGNVPPTAGDDPHGFPRAQVSARCQKSHFMHPQGAVIDVAGIEDPAECPALPPLGEAPPPGEPPEDGGDDPFSACAEDPADPACPLAPVAGLLDPEAAPALLEALQGCAEADNPAACAFETLQGATPEPLANCRPKLTGADCPAGSVVAGVLDALDQPVAPTGGVDPDPDSLGDSYAVYLESASGETIAFQVFEPHADSPSTATGRYPLVLQGHGYGGSRATGPDSFGAHRGAGYGVISIDQRGFGESSGTVRVMDPDFEGRDLVQILDWAEANLAWLAYAPATDDKPDTGRGMGNPLVGAIGGSYGGGYQLLLANVDPKRRLDALVPDITWNDLRYSLNPGDVVKSGWSLALVAGGEAGSELQQDPFIKETLLQGVLTNIFPADSLAWFNYHSPDYFCGAPPRRESVFETLPDYPGATVERRAPPALDVLFTQGMPDTLFNFNDAFYNYQCFKERGGDVRLYSHQSGHILPFPNVGAGNLTAGGGDKACGEVTLDSGVEIAWFDRHLKGDQNALDGVLDADHDVCLSLADGDAVHLEEVPVGGTEAALNGPVLARSGVAGAVPEVVSLGSVGAGGDVLAGVPRATLTVTLPGGGVPVVESPDRDLVRPLDSILFLGIGVKRAGGDAFELIDDQVQPVRGLGDFEIDLVGVGERLAEGDTLGLMIWGLHGQYPESFSRDPTVSLVTVDGSVALPLLDGNLAGGGGGDGGDDPLSACADDPAGEACPLAPLLGLLSPGAIESCLAGDEACPLNDLLDALEGGDPVGLVAALRETLAGLGECAQAEEPMVCAQATAGLVYAAANAAGLPITGPEAGATRCDLPAGDPDPVAEPLEWQLRDLENMLCATQRLTDMAANPAFVRRHVALGAQTYVENLANQAQEPTRPVLTLGQLVPGARVTDPFRYVVDWEKANRGNYKPVSFIASSGAKLEGRLFTPPADIPPPYPGIVITTGSIQGYQEMYNWAAEGLAEAGYLVLTYDVQGQGSSETFPHAPDGSIACGLDGCQGVPFQQDYNFFQGTRDALDFLLSSPASPYADAVPAADPDNPNAAGANPYNPLWPELDRRRIGIAGHSLGASAVSVVGQERACDPATPVPQRDGCVAAIVGWDALSAIAEDDQGEPVVPLRAPALSLTAEYFFNPTPANPQDPPDYDGGLAAYEQLKGAGVDAMRVALRSSTHLEWTYVPYILPASRYGERVSMHYTLAWMDRYVKGEADALERLAATHFDGSADASSIGAGTYDPLADANVPYRIGGDCVADRVSFYYRSAYFLSAQGESDTRNVEDLRARGCT